MYFQATFTKTPYPTYFHRGTWRSAKMLASEWANSLMAKQGLTDKPDDWKVDYTNEGFYRNYGESKLITLRFWLVKDYPPLPPLK